MAERGIEFAPRLAAAGAGTASANMTRSARGRTRYSTVTRPVIGWMGVYCGRAAGAWCARTHAGECGWRRFNLGCKLVNASVAFRAEEVVVWRPLGLIERFGFVFLDRLRWLTVTVVCLRWGVSSSEWCW